MDGRWWQATNTSYPFLTKKLTFSAFIILISTTNSLELQILHTPGLLSDHQKTSLMYCLRSCLISHLKYCLVVCKIMIPLKCPLLSHFKHTSSIIQVYFKYSSNGFQVVLQVWFKKISIYRGYRVLMKAYFYLETLFALEGLLSWSVCERGNLNIYINFELGFESSFAKLSSSW